MKIDLHCHTKSVKSGEIKQRNISPEIFKQKVTEANVKMIAITNHNEFDKTEFLKFKAIVDDEFILLPGIELDVIGINKETGHVVLVCDDKEIESFDSILSKLLNSKAPDDVQIDIKDLLNSVNSIDCLVIMHYWKTPNLSEETIKYIKEKINNQFRLFYEPSSFRSLGILINHDFRSIKGSDHDNWDTYALNDFVNVKLEMDSYRQFWNFIKKDNQVIETLLNKQTSYTVDIAYRQNKEEKIKLYDDVNVVFGTKGTGKSVLLDSVNKFFLSKGKKISVYNADKTQSKISEKLEISSVEKTLEHYGLESKKELFESVSKFADSNVTQIKDYIEYTKSKNKNKNRERMKIVDIGSYVENKTLEWKNAEDEYLSIKAIKTNLNNIALEKHLKQDSDFFLSMIEKLNNEIVNIYELSLHEKIATKLTNKFIDSIKAIVEKNTETKTKPTGSGLITFIKNRISLDTNILNIVKGFNYQFLPRSSFLGKLDSTKELYCSTTIKMLDSNSKTYDGFKNISKIREVQDYLFKIKDSIYSLKIDGLVDFIEQYNESKNMSLNDFLGITRKYTVNGVPYNPSTGEATMIVLNESLTADYDIYILDEPEKSLGNNYVNDVLVNKINDLAKQNKTIIVATHNANIAIRTFPYRTILKVYNNEYKTYVGSLYKNVLVNVHDSKDILDFKVESMKILEGGKEAFDERRGVYGN